MLSNGFDQLRVTNQCAHRRGIGFVFRKGLPATRRLQQLPWNGDIRDRTFEGFASISSKNGGVITIESPSHLEPSATIRHLADQAPAPRLKTLSTNYALLAAATEVKPDQVKWWKTRGQNAKCDESSVVSGPQMSSFSTSNSFSAPGRTGRTFCIWL
jgi:hypothetical protein